MQWARVFDFALNYEKASRKHDIVANRAQNPGQIMSVFCAPFCLVDRPTYCVRVTCSHGPQAEDDTNT
jgi:hypothetical protein